MEKPRFFARCVGTASALAALMALSGPARAVDADKVKYLGNDGSLFVKVKINYLGNAPSLSTVAGRFLMQFDGNNDGLFTDTSIDVVRKVFCVDVTHSIQTNDAVYAPVVDRLTGPSELLRKNTNDPDGDSTNRYFYQDAALAQAGGMVSAMTTNDYFKALPGSVPTAAEAAIRTSKVAWLVDKYLNAVASSSFTRLDFAAVQLAIWDIVQDGGDGIGAGNFKAVSNETGSGAITTATLQATVNAYLNQVSHIGNPHFGLYDSQHAMWVQMARGSGYGHLQDHVWTSAPVPEPAFYGMATLLGLGGLGYLRRRKKP